MDDTHTTQAAQQGELQKQLWAISNDLRGNMDASEYRNYILGLIFYRFLSERVSDDAEKLLEGETVGFAEAYADPAYQADLREAVIEDLGYFIAPQYLFPQMVANIKAGNFDVEQLQDAINQVQQSTLGHASEDDFRDLFEDMDLSSSRLGNTVAKRSDLIAKVILSLADISFSGKDIKIDVLGDAYEYMIGQFAASAGKKAGEFYTPAQVSKILARLVTLDRPELKSVYDPAMGSGSLLLQLGNYSRIGTYYGQELNGTTYNLARMNLLMHGVNYDRFKLKQGDTLEDDRFMGQLFDAVVANPPYSANWNPDGKLDDPRFRKYGKTAPKSKADFAFVAHMLYHLAENGTMAVVLPHGVLFRGAGEGVIRRYMIETDNVLDAVIGLPANLFYGTSIPTAVLVFKKARPNTDIFFIDASNEFEKGKNQNNLTDDQLDKIVAAYAARENVDKYAYKASLNEIKENDFNLNIPRYVDNFEEEEPVDTAALLKEMEELAAEKARLTAELKTMMADLVVTNPEDQHILDDLRGILDHE